MDTSSGPRSHRSNIGAKHMEMYKAQLDDLHAQSEVKVIPERLDAPGIGILFWFNGEISEISNIAVALL